MKKLPCLTSPTASNPGFPSKSWLWQTPLSFRSVTTSSLKVTATENITVIESRERRIRDFWQAKEKLTVNVHTACVSSPDALYETRLTLDKQGPTLQTSHLPPAALQKRGLSRKQPGFRPAYPRPNQSSTAGNHELLLPVLNVCGRGQQKLASPAASLDHPRCSLNAVWRRGGVVRAAVPTLAVRSPSDGKITRKRPSRALYLSPVKLQEVI